MGVSGIYYYICNFDGGNFLAVGGGGCQDFIFLHDLCTDLPGSGIHGGHAGKLAVR